MTVVRDQLFPQKPPGSRFRFSRTGVQPSPGSSTIELPSAFAESGAYPPDREPPGSPRQCSLPLACRHPPEGHQIGARKRRTPENTILSQPYCRRVSTDRSDREGSQLAASLEGEPGPSPAGKNLPHSYPETRFRRERARDVLGYHSNLLQSCHPNPAYCGHEGSSHLSPVLAISFFYRDARQTLLHLAYQWSIRVAGTHCSVAYGLVCHEKNNVLRMYLRDAFDGR